MNMEKLMNADAAYELAKKTKEANLDQLVEYYANQIREAAANGEFFVYGNGNMPLEVKDYLISKGYTVETSKNNEEPYWEISWDISYAERYVR